MPLGNLMLLEVLSASAFFLKNMHSLQHHLTAICSRRMQEAAESSCVNQSMDT